MTQTDTIPTRMRALVKREAAKGIWMDEVEVPSPAWAAPTEAANASAMRVAG